MVLGRVQSSVSSSMSTRQDLKLDIYIVDDEDGRRALVCLNFNIPNHIVSDAAGRYAAVLNEAADYLQDNVQQQQGNHRGISFQVSATYSLTNRVTGEEREWTGSFNYTATEFAVLSGHAFLPYDRNSFAQDVIRCTTDEHILECLQWTDADTDWTFTEVISIIVACQTSLSRNHDFFIRNRLLRGATRREKKRQLSIPHPW